MWHSRALFVLLVEGGHNAASGDIPGLYIGFV